MDALSERVRLTQNALASPPSEEKEGNKVVGSNRRITQRRQCCNSLNHRIKNLQKQKNNKVKRLSDSY